MTSHRIYKRRRATFQRQIIRAFEVTPREIGLAPWQRKEAARRRLATQMRRVERRAARHRRGTDPVTKIERALADFDRRFITGSGKGAPRGFLSTL